MLNVIIPCYKARKTLPDVLNSLVCQTYKMFLITICQDGDGEDYSDIIEEYQRRGLHINLLKSNENKGPGMARQMGIDNCGMCDYLMFIDADDIYTPRAVERMYKEAKKNLVDILSSDFIAETNHSSRYMKGQKTPVTWLHNKIYRVDYLKEKNIRFHEELRLNEDSYFNLVAANCTTKKCFLEEYTYIWRDNKNSLTRKEGSAEFFHKAWIQYIKSQIYGIEKIIEINNTMDIAAFAATIINIYNHMMRAIHYKENLEEAITLIERLKENKIAQDLLNEKDFWTYLYHNLKVCGFLNKDEMFFFKERFIDWYMKYIKKTDN